MKSLKIILMLALIFTLASCKDKVTTHVKSENTVIRPPVTPSPDDNLSPLPFKGIEKIDNIGQDHFTVHWTPLEGAGSYQIFFLSENGIELQKSYNHPANHAKVTGLLPDQEYTVLVRMMDREGRIDINKNSLTARTNLWPDYINQRSLLFRGSQAVQLAKSNELISNQRVTLSLWFKTSVVAADSRLMTFHSEINASTALALGLEDNQVYVLYKTPQNETKKLQTEFLYTDNQWHHVVVTYYSNWFTLYLDGVRVKSVNDGLIAFGAHPASIGSTTGINLNTFQGLIDEVSLWTSSLSNKDIELIYNEGAPNDLRMHPSKIALRSWYRMGDDPQDSIFEIIDQISGKNATPIGVMDMSYFVQDTP